MNCRIFSAYLWGDVWAEVPYIPGCIFPRYHSNTTDSIPVVSCWCFHCLVRQENKRGEWGLRESFPSFPSQPLPSLIPVPSIRKRQWKHQQVTTGIESVNTKSNINFVMFILLWLVLSLFCSLDFWRSSKNGSEFCVSLPSSSYDLNWEQIFTFLPLLYPAFVCICWSVLFSIVFHSPQEKEIVLSPVQMSTYGRCNMVNLS